MSLLKRLRAANAPSSVAVRPLLEAHCDFLHNEILELKLAIESAALPAEVEVWLQSYRKALLERCELYLTNVQKAEGLLEKNRDDVIEDVFFFLENTNLRVQQLSEYLLSPLLRSNPDDWLGLKFLTWLHREHPSAQKFPLAICDGSPAIFPFLQIAPLYFFPFRAQRGLLLLPLLLHEFGHLLVSEFEEELRDEIADLRQQIDRHLTPASRRNDQQNIRQTEIRRSVGGVYYFWTMEFFCDAVGLTLGGPAFLFAFSDYLDSWKKTSFNLPPERMALSKHPVTWMRVHQLVRRSKSLGWHEAANSVEERWKTLAQALGAKEDHGGFYDAQIASIITSKIDDMLEVTGPRQIEDYEANAQNWREADSPIALLNAAWHHRNTDKNSFLNWEKEWIALYSK